MLVDLDELILKCPDPQSRAYIKEAIICYKNGAYRSAIVSTWIAICFDLIDKIRALAGAGDLEAIKLNGDFEKISAQGDISAALKFEKSLLDVAKDKLEFISPLEYIDLKRIIEDRNRCAHPSQMTGSVAFEPTSELARLHIVNAAQHILMQPAAQGKATLQRLTDELTSVAFPSKPGDIQKYLAAGPLGKPRKALLRNYLILVLKSYIASETDYNVRRRMALVITALAELHPKDSREILEIEFNRLLDAAPDTILRRITDASQHQVLWGLVAEKPRLKIISYVENLPVADLDYCEDLMDGALASTANTRLAKAKSTEIMEAVWFILPGAAITRLLKLLRLSKNWATSNKIATFLKDHASEFDGEHIKLLFQAAAATTEVSDSLDLPKLVAAIAARGVGWRALINEAAAEYGLEKLAVG